MTTWAGANASTKQAARAAVIVVVGIMPMVLVRVIRAAAAAGNAEACAQGLQLQDTTQLPAADLDTAACTAVAAVAPAAAATVATDHEASHDDADTTLALDAVSAEIRTLYADLGIVMT